MQFEIEKLSDIQQKITFSVPAVDVDSELGVAYAKLKKRASIAGFRPGKAPRTVLRRRFGEKVTSEVANSFLQTAFEDELKSLDYFGQPRVETEGLKEGCDFDFSFIIEVEPEVSLDTYKGLDIVFPTAPVDDARVDAQIESKLVSRASLAAVTEARPVRSGDSVMVSLTVSAAEAADDGEPEVLDQAPGTMINVGAEQWYKGLDAQLIDREVDAPFTLEMTFPEDAGNAAVAGQAVRIEGTVLGIQELRPPELTDELAGELGYEGGVEGMRAALRAQLQEGADEGARNQARANLLQALVGANAFEVPTAMSEQFFEALLQEVQLQQWQQGRDVRQARFSDAEVADLRGRAQFAAKASLILKKIAELESITVEDDELDGKIQEIADQRDQRVEAIKAYLQKEEAVEQLRDRIMEEKTLDWLLEQSNLIASSAGSAPSHDDADAAPGETPSEE